MVIRPTWQLCVMAGAIAGGGAAFFFLHARLGQKVLEVVEGNEQEDTVDRSAHQLLE